MLFRTELIYFKNDGTYVLMSFIWAILIPLLIIYVNSFFLNVVFCDFNTQDKKINR